MKGYNNTYVGDFLVTNKELVKRLERYVQKFQKYSFSKFELVESDCYGNKKYAIHFKPTILISEHMNSTSVSVFSDDDLDRRTEKKIRMHNVYGWGYEYTLTNISGVDFYVITAGYDLREGIETSYGPISDLVLEIETNPEMGNEIVRTFA